MAKFALCIGINNYPGTGMDLAGCVNDAADWAEELGGRGFEVARLIDSRATKAGIVAGIEWVIGQAAPDDVVVITFSGHGTWQPAEGDDEDDGLDEGLCPYDVQTRGEALIDNEIHALFKARKPGVRLVLISDSCHSGTVNREIRSGAAADGAPRKRFLPMGNWLPAERAGAPATPRVTSPRDEKSRSAKTAFDGALDDLGDVLLSGCEEGEDRFSYDATIKGRPNGAFTFYALKALRDLPEGASYADWHAAVTPESLPTPDYDQVPQLVGSPAAVSRAVFT